MAQELMNQTTLRQSTFQSTTTLKILPKCGNAVVENPPESCDNGMQCEDGTVCKSDTDCKPTSLYGPIVPGPCAPRSGDGCSAECLIEVTAATTFQATYQAPNTQTVQAAPYFRAEVQVLPKCGNGVLESSEGCDDGNLVGGDGCSAECLIEVTAITTLKAEYKAPESQPTMQINNQVYAEVKQASVCGNGVKEDGESCDDGNLTDGDGCSSTCLMEFQRMPLYQEAPVYQEKETYTVGPLKQEYNLVVVHCGNGTTELDLGERCDDGNLVDGDGCNSKCQLELKAVYGAPVPVRETTSYETVPGKVYVPAASCGDNKIDAGEECEPPNTASCSADCKNLPPPDPCLSAGPVGSPEYQCCKTYLNPAATLAALAYAGPSDEAKKAYECCVKNGGAIPTEPGFDAATCSYLKPECKVTGPSTVSKGEKADFTVADSAGLPFASFECKESPAPAAGTEAVAVLVSQGDYPQEVYSLATRDQQMSIAYQPREQVSTVYATRSSRTTEISSSKTLEAQPAGMNEGSYPTTVDSDKIITCTITGPGGTSDPCVTTVRVGECSFSCEPWKTSVGLDADCKLLKKPGASLCSVSVNAAAAVVIADDGFVSVPTDNSGVQSFDVQCEGATFKALCGDKMEVAPVCEGITVKINGADGTGQTAL